MYDVNDRARPDQPGGHRARSTTTRRMLVRGAAWSVPVVSVATAAPARAATSADPASVTVEAAYWVKQWPNGTYGVVPMITVRNPSQLTGQVMIQLDFAVGEFTGTGRFTDPPSPDFTNIPPLPSSDGGWVVDQVPPLGGDTSVGIRLLHDEDLGAGAHTIGDLTATDNPASFVWANEPTASVHVVLWTPDPWLGLVAGVMARVPPPVA